MTQATTTRKESDRLASKGWLKSLLARPEIGPIGVMLLLFGMLGYFSIPAGEFSLNPFAGEGFNALGIRNNLRVIAQLGIIALGAGLLIIAGEFDLSIGSMIGLIGCLMTLSLMKWEFSIATTLLIVLVVSVGLGVLHGVLITKAHLQPFVVTLCGLLIYRGAARWITDDATGGFGQDYNESLRLLATGRPFSTSAVLIVLGIAAALYCIGRISKAATDHEQTGGNTNGKWIFGIVISVGVALSGTSRFYNFSEQTVLNLANYTSVEIYNKFDSEKLDIKTLDESHPEKRPSQFMPEISLNYLGYLALPLAIALAIFFLQVDRKTAGLAILLLVSGAAATYFSSNQVQKLFANRQDIGMASILKVTLSLGVFILGLDRFLKGVYKALPERRGLLVITCVLAMCWLVSQTPICRVLVPAPMIFLTVIAIAAAIFLNQTIYGRYLLALGNNETAARLSGINTDRMIILAYVICAFCTAISGILFALDGNSIQPAGHGNFYELYAIAAAVLGGCSLRGGEGSIAGVVIGAAVMRVLYNSITLLKIPTTLEFAIIGVVIMIGVLADEAVKKLNHKKRQQEEVLRVSLVDETNPD